MTKYRRFRFIALSAVLTVAFVAMVVLPSAPVVVAGALPQAAVGMGPGFWAAFTCVACLSGFVIGGGLTIAGFAAFLAVNPEIGVYCVASCAAALS